MINPKKRKKNWLPYLNPISGMEQRKLDLVTLPYIAILIWEHVFIAIIGGELTQYPANTQVYSAPAT